jgi:hypothetical protein
MAYDVSVIEFITTPAIVITNYFVFLFSSIVYTIATIIVLTISYPATYKKILFEISTANTKKMTFIELYFTGNLFLVTSWLIFLGTLPMIIYPIWGLIIGYVTIESGLTYLLSLVILLLFLYVFVVACFPENLLHAFQGSGTSVIFDGCVKYFCFSCSDKNEKNGKNSCCGSNSFFAEHLGKDHLVILWFVFAISVFSVIGSIYYVAIDYYSVLSWLWLISSLAFAIGSYLYCIESYTGTGESSLFYDLCCCKSKKMKKRANSDENTVSNDERMPLVTNENSRKL